MSPGSRTVSRTSARKDSLRRRRRIRVSGKLMVQIVLRDEPAARSFQRRSGQNQRNAEAKVDGVTP